VCVSDYGSRQSVCLWYVGQQRSRMLATLFKDERCQQLPTYGILEKMYAFFTLFSAHLKLTRLVDVTGLHIYVFEHTVVTESTTLS